jgi:hypothetical protein
MKIDNIVIGRVTVLRTAAAITTARYCASSPLKRALGRDDWLEDAVETSYLHRLLLPGAHHD